LSLHLVQNERVLSFAYLIHRFKENVEDDIGVGGRVEVTAANYTDMRSSTMHTHFQRMSGLLANGMKFCSSSQARRLFSDLAYHDEREYASSEIAIKVFETTARKTIVSPYQESGIPGRNAQSANLSFFAVLE
jgi:hypothetical protein